MPRGRKKDLTIPPTRSLVQQRDYRARKANYIANLEERFRKVEEENACLRKELFQARAQLSVPAVLRPETAEASKELMHSLSLASTSLANFQRLAFCDTRPTHEITLSTDFRAYHSTRAGGTHQSPPTAQSQTVNGLGKKQLYSERTPPFSPISQSVPTSPFCSPSPGYNEECCGGIVDCDAMVSDRIIQDEEERKRETAPRISELRSTSDSRLQADLMAQRHQSI